jgi:hypothetical protein
MNTPRSGCPINLTLEAGIRRLIAENSTRVGNLRT